MKVYVDISNRAGRYCSRIKACFYSALLFALVGFSHHGWTQTRGGNPNPSSNLFVPPAASASMQGKPPLYSGSCNKTFTITGIELSCETVFRLLPVTLPLPGIRVTSLYGMRTNPFTHTGEEFHPGVDFGAATGTPVYSTGAGKVSYVGSRGAYGMMIAVVHPFGFETRYSHLSYTNVVVGQVVDRHSLIGLVGSTGRSTGPHLYYEIWHQGVRVDPIPLIIKAYLAYGSLVER